MSLFDDVFNKASIYDTFFFNVNYVLEYPNIKELEKNNINLYNCWLNQPINKYLDSGGVESTYNEKAINYPEFVKIVAITYGTIYMDGYKLKRHFKKIVGDDENVVLNTFINVLSLISSDGIKSTPNYFPILCGYDITKIDIPILIKRFLYKKENMESKTLPYILKRALTLKPWESGVIDVVNVWKFNGGGGITLETISNYMGLKKTVNLLTPKEISNYYWDNIETKPDDTLEYISLQSATTTNLVIQLMNDLRQI